MDSLVSLCMSAFGALIDIEAYTITVLGCLVLGFTIILIQWLFKAVI